MREAHLIVVLKDGEVAEQGTHQALFDRGGIYRGIYELQLRPGEELMLDAAIAADNGGDG